MSALAVGIDLVDVPRIRDLLAKHGERFVGRTFTEGESDYCSRCADPAMHFAARFAAKEAVAKALGTGFSDGISWQEIEVLRTEEGAPSVALHGRAAQRAAELGIGKVLISLTHTKELAAAQVVAVP